MNKKTILKILNLDNTEKYFLGKDCLIKVFADDTIAFIRYKCEDIWVPPGDLRSSPRGYPFHECRWNGAGEIIQISNEEAFEILL